MSEQEEERGRQSPRESRSGRSGRGPLARFASKFVGRRRALSERPRRVLALEPAEGTWKALEAELRGRDISILRAEVVQRAGPADSQAAPALGDLSSDADCVLVSSSGNTVFRVLDLPEADENHTKRLVAVRLETELPYPVEESAWVFKRHGGEEGGEAREVLVLATPAAEVSQGEAELRAAGRRCRLVDFDVGALAALAAAPSPEATVGLARVDETRTTLVITKRGRLCYVRRISCGAAPREPGGTTADQASRLASELDQSLCEYMMKTAGEMPRQVVIVGRALRVPGFVEALGAQMTVPVEAAVFPRGVRAEGEAARRDDLLAEYPACLGAVLAAARRRRGEPAPAPAIHRGRPAFAEARARRRVALVAADVLLAAALIAALFAVQATRLRTANRIIEDAKTRDFRQELDALDEEVRILQFEGRSRTSMLEVLKALAEVLPKGMAVSSLTIDDAGKVTIAGSTPSVEMASQKAVAAMEASAIFVNPRFRQITQEKDNITFSITCELRNRTGGHGS